MSFSPIWVPKKPKLEIPDESRCFNCGAGIFFVPVLDYDRPQPIDTEADDRGNLVFSTEAQKFRVLRGEALRLYKISGGLLFRSHKDSCRNDRKRKR